MRIRSSLLRPLKAQLKFWLVVALGYLVQTCVMPYLRVGEVTPSLMFAVTAIITVGYGRLRAFWVGGVYGIVMEIMMPAITMLNLALYPASAVLCSLAFADKSEKRLEYERGLGKPGRNANPYLRTVACAAVNALIYEAVNVVYIYLGGIDLEWAHFSKALLFILLTTALTAVLMLPIRRYLGFRKAKKQPAAPAPQYL